MCLNTRRCRLSRLAGGLVPLNTPVPIRLEPTHTDSDTWPTSDDYCGSTDRLVQGYVTIAQYGTIRDEVLPHPAR